MIPPRTLFTVWLDRDDTRFIRSRCRNGKKPSEYLLKLLHEERRRGIEEEKKYQRELTEAQIHLALVIRGVANRKDREASPGFTGEMLSPKAHLVKPVKRKAGRPRGRPRLKGTQ